MYDDYLMYDFSRTFSVKLFEQFDEYVKQNNFILELNK